jgi:hypothetical protein
VERSVPDCLHGRTQALLLVFFEALRKKLSFYACSETRVKLRECLYLIPDVSVFRRLHLLRACPDHGVGSRPRDGGAQSQSCGVPRNRPHG